MNRKARFVDEHACTGCRLCETACTVAVPDQFNGELVARRAAYIAFPQAVPKKARHRARRHLARAPFACPAGIKAHGYVSLVRSGKYEEAFQLVLETTPLVGTLGRACYAPVRGRVHPGLARGDAADPPCSSASSPTATTRPPDGPGIEVGRAQRQARWRSSAPALPVSPPPGSWRARATASRSSRRPPQPGGVPPPRHPRLPPAGRGRRARHRQRHRRSASRSSPAPLSTTSSRPEQEVRRRPRGDRARRAPPASASPARTACGVRAAPDFLRQVKLGQPLDLTGKRVVVIGGGNVAIDAARTARRLGAASVTVACRRGRARDARPRTSRSTRPRRGRGTPRLPGPRPRSWATPAGAVERLALPAHGARRAGRFGSPPPRADPGQRLVLPCDMVLVAIGMAPGHGSLPRPLAANANGTLVRPTPSPCRRPCPYVFAAGDVVTGATTSPRRSARAGAPRT